MISIKLLGGAKKSFGTDFIPSDLDNITITQLLDYLLSIKPQNTADLDTKNTLIAVNGIDSSALNGFDTILHSNDVISIIPIIHGGAYGRNQFKIQTKYVESFNITNVKSKNYDFLDLLRTKFDSLVLEGISSKYILGTTHAKKILGISFFAQKHNSLLSKKLETDILLRFGITTQISEAIKIIGIENCSDFTVIAIGNKSILDRLHDHLKPFLNPTIQFDNNAKFIQKQFKITKKHFESIDSKTALEDLLAEKAAVLIQ